MSKKKQEVKISPELGIDTHFYRNLSFAASEQYKLLRTNLMFTLPDDVKCPIIGISSSTRGEGKSTTSINLAYALSNIGKKVLLIDGDLRLPSIAIKLGIKNTYGLTDLLVGSDKDVIQKMDDEGWYIMPSGQLPPNPSELLSSAKMEKILQKEAEQFDAIIIDLPPVNIVSDPLAISPYLTGMILVVRENYTEKEDFEACKRQLKMAEVNVLGVVMNCSNAEGDYNSKYRKYKKYYGKRGYYGKYGYGYSYGRYGYAKSYESAAKERKKDRKA